MSNAGNTYLDHDESENSDLDRGYDSEAEEVSKAAHTRSLKRRKLSHSDSEESQVAQSSEDDDNDDGEVQRNGESEGEDLESDFKIKSASWALSKANSNTVSAEEVPKSGRSKQNGRDEGKRKKPGVIYLSSLPPYLKPFSLRNMLEKRGFEPITKLFLSPSSKAKSSSKKNSRQLYSEGWIEFASKKTARACAETLNAAPIGGKKGGYYHDDLWNMKYLKGMGWSELMAGVREEKREEEGRRDEERRMIAKETKRFVEGVEEGKRLSGMKRKRNEKNKDKGSDITTGDLNDSNIKRTWRQFEIQGNQGGVKKGKGKDDHITNEVQQVLSKIF